MQSVQFVRELFLSSKSFNNKCCYVRIFIARIMKTTTSLIRTHVSCVVMTNNHNTIAPTVFFQLPVAIHLSLSLNPVAAVRPQSGLGLSNHGGAWGEAGQQLCYGEGSELQTTINVRGGSEQVVMCQLIWRYVWTHVGRTRKVKKKVTRWCVVDV